LVAQQVEIDPAADDTITADPMATNAASTSTTRAIVEMRLR
jgi:hypothetical protein